MLDIFATRLIKWLIVFAAISTITHVYGLTTGDTELVSPIAYTQTLMPLASPEGGYWVGMLDNSPTYSDGRTLLVDDSTSPPVISWRAPKGY